MVCGEDGASQRLVRKTGCIVKMRFLEFVPVMRDAGLSVWELGASKLIGVSKMTMVRACR